MASKEDIDDILDLLEEGETGGDDDIIDIEDGDDDDGQDGEGGEGPADKGGEEEGKGDGAGDGGEGGGEGGDEPPVTTGEPKAPAAPANLFQVPADAKDRIARIESDMAEVEKQWDAGDIGDAEFKRRTKELAAEAADLSARIQANNLVIAQRQREQQEAEDLAWRGAVEGFKKANPALWADNHRPRFNEHVKAVTADARYQALPFEQQLRLAANFYSSELAALGQDAPAIAAPKPAKAAAKTVPARPPLPPTLGGRPAAAINAGTDSPFAHIEALERKGDVDGAEAAVAALSPAQREAYLQGVDLG